MTAKQKANRERFKKVVAEAKKLRKKNPKLTQAQAVKQAWAIMYSKTGTSKKVGATKIVQKGESKNAKVTKVLQQTRTKKGQFKGYKRIAGEKHTDTKSHNVNIRVVSGIKTKRKKVGAMPTYKDAIAAREIELYADNDSQLYFSRRLPILKNLQKKYKKGIYEIDKAAKLWKYYIEAAMQKYNKEFGSRGNKWSDLLSVNDRNLLATEYAIRTKQEFDNGEFVD